MGGDVQAGSAALLEAAGKNPRAEIVHVGIASTYLTMVRAVAIQTLAPCTCQASIVGLIVSAYFSLEASSSSILSGSQALAYALVSGSVSCKLGLRRRWVACILTIRHPHGCVSFDDEVGWRFEVRDLILALKSCRGQSTNHLLVAEKRGIGQPVSIRRDAYGSK